MDMDKAQEMIESSDKEIRERAWKAFEDHCQSHGLDTNDYFDVGEAAGEAPEALNVGGQGEIPKIVTIASKSDPNDPEKAFSVLVSPEITLVSPFYENG